METRRRFLRNTGIGILSLFSQRQLSGEDKSKEGDGVLFDMFISDSDSFYGKPDEGGRIMSFDDFLNEITQYDIIHFGEMHSTTNDSVTTTLEDFVEEFLPKLRDQRGNGKNYDLLRVEHLPNEISADGTQCIDDEELQRFDETGIISRKNTPTIYRELFIQEN